MITAEKVRHLFSYNPNTGIFTRLITVSSGARAGDIAGSKFTGGYLRVGILGKYYLLHRLAWLHVHGEWPKYGIDHINGDPSDNRIDNLRDVTQAINQQNQRKAQTGSATKVLGVYHSRGRYLASILVSGKTAHLGRFDTAELAHQVYLEAKRKLHPGCTI